MAGVDGAVLGKFVVLTVVETKAAVIVAEVTEEVAMVLVDAKAPVLEDTLDCVVSADFVEAV